MTEIEKKFPKVAIIADQMSFLGGADREMFSILKILPKSEIYTIVFNKTQYPNLKNNVHTSFVQRISNILPKQFYRHLKIFTPFAYESFDLRGYDLVISISAGPARGAITGIDQPHIAMVMTPPRSLWDKELNARSSIFKSIYYSISIILNTFMRVWDWSTSKRIEYWTSNSKYIARKVKKIYGKESQVIYPGVNPMYFKPVGKKYREQISKKYSIPKNFVLIVSRLYDHKRIDWAISSCIHNKRNLVIVGEGPDRKYLEKVSNNSPYIKFLGFVKDDKEVKAMYELSELLIFSGLEDFGLVPVEAMASGKPVLAYAKGGLLETVKDGITGEFFLTEEELNIKLKKFDKTRYNSNTIIKHAQKFSEEKFLINFEKYLHKIHEKEIEKRRQH